MGESIWVNHPDVQALLNSWKGSPFSTDKEHEVLLDKRAGIYPASDVNNASASHAVFILEDLKDEIEAELKNLKMDHYCMQLSLASGDVTILLPESIENQLNKILDSGKKLSYDELKEDKTLSDIMFRASDFLQLAPCDEKMLTLNGYLQVYYYVSPEGEKSVLIGGNTGDEDFYIGLDNTAFYNELKALRNEALQ